MEFAREVQCSAVQVVGISTEVQCRWLEYQQKCSAVQCSAVQVVGISTEVQCNAGGSNINRSAVQCSAGGWNINRSAVQCSAVQVVGISTEVAVQLYELRVTAMNAVVTSQQYPAW